jgi:integrase
MNIHGPTEELFTEYLNDQYNSYTGEISVFKKRQRIRVVNLVKSYIANGEVDTSRKPGKSVKDQIKSPDLRLELEKYVQLLKDDQIQPNTICTYQRIVAYLLIYCEEKSYCSVEELVSGDIRDFILYLYDHGCFKPSTITSGLAGLKRFLSLYPTIKYLMMELPSHLPRERKILEIYSDSEMEAIHRVLDDNSMTKRDKAICLLVLETGLRGVDICNIRLSDIDWSKDIIHIFQQKTGRSLNLPLRESYGNAIADYLLNERPKCKSPYLFVRELAPFSHLDGEGGSVRVVLERMESLAGICNCNRSTGSRTTRHNAASTMLKADVPLSNISAVLGHYDANIVTVYLSTDKEMMAACTLPLPRRNEP